MTLSSEAFLARIDFEAVLNNLDEGVIVTDGRGVVLHYNPTMARIDQISIDFALGKPVIDLYDLTPDTSLIMTCLKTGRPILNRLFVYRTRFGRVANTICHVQPLRDREERPLGTICLVREYGLTAASIQSAAGGAAPRPPARDNGTDYTFADLIGSSPSFTRALGLARLAARSPSPVMLFGETGTGKELFAQAMHNEGPRQGRPYTAINCAAIPENLLEGILFGTSRGAFTGAVERPGLFEQAQGGSLYLDEIDSMPVGLQAKLLRVLQERKVRRVGSLRETPVDLKIMSSVATDPRRAMAGNLLRGDLFYRLGVVLIQLPPLRERREDLAELSTHFVNKFNRALGSAVRDLAPATAALFAAYAWPGNIRELEHVIEAAMNLAGGEAWLGPQHLPPHFFQAAVKERAAARTVAEAGAPALAPVVEDALWQISRFAAVDLAGTQASQERSLIQEALARADGNVARAARGLGLSRQCLHYKLKKHGLK